MAPVAVRPSAVKMRFERVYRDYQPLVRGVLYNMTGFSVLDDLTQEVFLKVWKALPRFALRSTEKTWVYRIAVNTAIDHLRKKSLSQLPLEEESLVIRTETSHESEIQAALQMLDEHHRGVLVLFYFEELDLKRIARILEIPLGTVKSRLHTAREKMKDILSEKGLFNEIS